MIQFDDETKSLLSDLLKSTADLEDMLPRSGDERISDPITFALTLGEAIGVRKVCKQLGCKEDELLKSEMICTEMTIAKGKGLLKSSVNITDVCKYKLLHLMMDSIDDLVDICFERKGWTYSVKCDPSDAINISYFFYKLAKADTLLKVAEIVFDGIHNDEEIEGHINMLRGIISDSEKITKHIIDDFEIYVKKSKQGRKKADTSLSLLDVLDGNKTLYDKIVLLNAEKKIYGVRVGHLYVALIEGGVLSQEYSRRTFYNAIEREFGNIGDYSNIDDIIRNSLNERTLKESDKLKISHIRNRLF